MSKLLEKEKLISYFFEIRGNEQMEKLRNCKTQCERLLLLEEDDDIRDLFNVMNALMIYFETGDKVESRKWVIGVWEKINLKINYSFFDIRIINHILFTETDIDKVVKIVENILIQLEIYKFHEDYLRIKNALNLNLLNLLMDSKFFDESFKVEYEDLIVSKIDEILMLNLESKINNSYFVGLASLYDGILKRNKKTIYIASLLLGKTSQNNQEIDGLIKTYMKRYAIEV